MIKAGFARLEQALGLVAPLRVCVVDEAALALHCGLAVSWPVAVDFDVRVILPELRTTDSVLMFTRPPSPSLSLIPGDYRRRAAPLDLGTSMLLPHLIDPVDLAVSFLGRCHAQSAIELLAGQGLLSAGVVEQRAREVMKDLAGGRDLVEADLAAVLKCI